MNKKVFGSLALAFAVGAGAPTVANSIIDLVSTSSQSKSASTPVGQPIDLTYAAENGMKSVVYLKVTTNSKMQMQSIQDPFFDFFGDFFGQGNGGRQQRQVQVPKRQGSGSGVIISSDGYIVTNNHVVADADEILVKLSDNREVKARIIGLDPSTDLALLKVEEKNLQPIAIADSDNLKIGEWVLAIGNPYGLTSTVTAGIVSAKARTLGVSSGIESFIQTDAAINPGNSGGALVNAKGELVGINAMLYSQTGSYAGYGFAIPTTIMNKVVSDLKKFGTVQRALLGVTGMDVSSYISQQHEKNKEVDLGTLKGIYVEEATSDGAAQEGGLQKGDVITAIDGKATDSFGEMQEILASYKPGDQVAVTYLRDKKKRIARLTLRNAQGTTSTVQSIGAEELGVGMRTLTEMEKRELNLTHGLVVNAIRNGKFQEAGITKGIILLQVNDKPMRTLEDFEAVVKEVNMSSDRVLWIRAKTQSGLNRSFTVELSDPKVKGKK